MKSRRDVIAVSVLLILMYLSGVPALAQRSAKWPIDVVKGERVVLKVPFGLTRFPKTSGFFSFTDTYEFEIDQAGNQYLIDGKADWKDVGPPWQKEWTLSKVEVKKEYTSIELEAKDVFTDRVRLRFLPSVKDVGSAFQDIAYRGSLNSFQESPYFREEVPARLLPRMFSGKLAEIPKDVQLNIVKEIGYNMSAIAAETYKGKTVFVYRETSTEVYDDILPLSERVSRAIEKDGLAALRKAYKWVAGQKTFDGLKLELKVKHKDLSKEDAPSPGEDDVQIYAWMDDARRFAENDVTSQSFIQNCIVLVNGNRVDVDLRERRTDG